MKKNMRSAIAIRLVVLGIVLLLVAVGAILEFGVSKPGFSNASASLDALAKENLQAPKTRKDVIDELGGSPADSKFSKKEMSSNEELTVRFQRKDHYKWMRIIPGKKKREIFVVYDRLVSGSDATELDPKSFSDADWSFNSFYEAGNAPKQDISVQAKKRSPTDRIFATLDEDATGFISIDQLDTDSELYKKLEFDQDNDGKISKKEFESALVRFKEAEGRDLTVDEQYNLVGGKSPGEGVGPPAGGGGKKGGGKKGGGKKGGGKKGGGKKGEGKKGEGN